MKIDGSVGTQDVMGNFISLEGTDDKSGNQSLVLLLIFSTGLFKKSVKGRKSSESIGEMWVLENLHGVFNI